MNKAIILLGILTVNVLADYNDDLVNSEDLKKFNVILDEKVYAGYLSANEDQSAQFYYVFLVSDPSLPVTLWLNGGPGCSSLQGLFNENGPLNFIHKTTTLQNNTYPWTKASNMLYLESPIGVGFSYGDIKKLPNQTQTDESTAKLNLQAMITFFSRFYQFQSSEFYISGESYAGIYIPTLANEILNYNKLASKAFTINLKGLLIGNGCTHPSECTAIADTFPYHFYKYIGGHNLISEAMYESLDVANKTCYGTYGDPFCELFEEEIGKEFTSNGNLDHYNIYADCPFETIPDSNKLNTLGYKNNFLSGFRQKLPACDDDIGIYSLLRNIQFITTMHVDTTKSSKWDVCNGVHYQIGDEATYYLYPTLIKAGLRIWKFSGDIDSVVPITGTLYWIDLLQKENNLRTIVPWRAWYKAGDLDKQRQVGGNYWRLDGLTFVSVKNAGHMVPTNQKQSSLDMFQAFLKGKDLPSD